MILNICNIIIYNLFITKPVYLLSSTKFQFEKMRTSGGGGKALQRGKGCQKRTFAEMGEEGLGKCRRPPNFGDFPQNSI